MPEEIGFRTPAKELEKLRKRLEQVEDASKYVPDVTTLEIWALALIHYTQGLENPKQARELKDIMLDGLKKAGITPELLDALDELYKINCERLEKRAA